MASRRRGGGRGQRGRTAPRPRRRDRGRATSCSPASARRCANCRSRSPRTSPRSTSRAPPNWRCCRRRLRARPHRARGLADQPGRGCRHPRQDHHRQGGQQVRRPVCGRGGRSMRAQRRCRASRRSASPCTSAARSSASPPIAPPTPALPNSCGRCARRALPSRGSIAAAASGSAMRRAGRVRRRVRWHAACSVRRHGPAAHRRARPLAGRPGRRAAGVRGAGEGRRAVRGARRGDERPDPAGDV